MPLDQHPTPRNKQGNKAKKKPITVGNFDEKLKAYPNLREKLWQVLDAADNQGGIVEADAAEELIVELMRDLGGLTMQTWAENRSKQSTQEFKKAHPEAQDKGKKTPLVE